MLLWLLCLAAFLALSSRLAIAQTFDATNLREPVEVGIVGVVQVGDNPAFAQPGFDDSKWLPVNAKSRLSDYFPHTEAGVVWQRLHVKVDPAQSGMALQALSFSRAFEVYVNGQKLIESGQVEPYVPYTRYASLIVRIPDAQLRTGSLVIAVRARATHSWWTRPSPGFDAFPLALGEESALRNQVMLHWVSYDAEWVMEAILGLAVGLVALALFSAYKQQREYLWVSVSGALEVLTFFPGTYSQFHNFRADWWMIESLLGIGIDLVLLLVVQAFMRLRLNGVLWTVFIISVLLDAALDTADLHGSISLAFYQIVDLPVVVVLSLLIPFVLLRELYRGNREAGILLIPFLLFGLDGYVRYILALLEFIPALRAAGAYGDQLVNSLHIGIISLSLPGLGHLSFWLSLAVIMVLRSARISRQQAALEGEMAAAREVQQVILPEEVESIPGFTVESVYRPAQQVGGDFFQILPTIEGGLLVVVGDVAGKGLPAAMLVSVLVGAIRTVAEDSDDPAVMLSRLNNRLLGRTHGGFSTALAAHITADGWVNVANAGHLSPYLDGREIELPGALPLGIVGNARYETTQFHLPHGSRLTFYSDGVVEAQNQKGELLGFDRAKGLSTEPAVAIVEAAVQFGQSDDITVVAIARHVAIATAA